MTMILVFIFSNFWFCILCFCCLFYILVTVIDEASWGLWVILCAPKTKIGDACVTLMCVYKVSIILDEGPTWNKVARSQHVCVCVCVCVSVEVVCGDLCLCDACIY